MRRAALVLAFLACAAMVAYFLHESGARRAPDRAGHATASPEQLAPGLPPAPDDRPPALPPAPEAPSVDEAIVRSASPEVVTAIAPAPVGTLVGTVRLADGMPPDGTKIVVTSESPHAKTRIAQIDPAGQVWLSGLAPGRYRLRAAHDGYAPRSFAFDVPEGGGAGPFDIVLVSGGSLGVRVVDPTGNPLPAHPVQVIAFAGEVVEGRTGEAGDCLFEHLPTGEYWVRCAESQDGAGAGRTAAVAPGSTTDVVFEISCVLTGTVYGADGQTLSGAAVRLVWTRSDWESYRHASGLTDDAGRFTLRGFASGEYVPLVGLPGTPPSLVAFEPITFEAGQTKREDLRISPYAIEGRVMGECPPGTVMIQAIRVEVNGGEVASREGYYAGWLTPDGSSASHATMPDATGWFRLPGLARRWYEVWAISSDRGGTYERQLVDLRSGGTGNVEFRLPRQPAGKARLRILEADHTPATGILFAEHLTEGADLSLTPMQAGDGVFDLVLPVGLHRVVAYRAAWSTTIALDVTEQGCVERSLIVR